MRHPISLPFLVGLALCLTACGGDDDGGSSSGDPDAQMMAPDAETTDMDPPMFSDAGAEPELTLDPLSLSLTASPGMPSEPGTITLRNIGQADLVISNVTVNAVDGGDFALVNPGLAPATLAPEESLAVEVIYTPAGPGEASAALVIESNDSDEGNLSLPITGRVATDCFRVQPASVDLGDVEPGVPSARFQVSALNCGDTAVTLPGVELEGDDGFMWMAEGGAPAGRVLQPGDNLNLSLTFAHDDLAPDTVATSTLAVLTDLATRMRVEVALRATAVGPSGCRLVSDLDQVEFGQLRIGTDTDRSVTLTNLGTGECTIRDVFTEGELFSLVSGGDLELLGPGAEAQVEVRFAPVIAQPQGDRGSLKVNYFDPGREENRQLDVFLSGIGAEAQIGSLPVNGRDFGKVTSGTCASPDFVAGATNIGFVPICVTGYRLEGENCDRFFMVSAPEIGECLPLERVENAEWVFAYEPSMEGLDECNLIVTSDAMNEVELTTRMWGEGVASDMTEDSFTVGRLNGNNRAFFNLSRPSEPEGITVLRNDEPDMRFGFDADRNAIFYDPDDHPRRDDNLLVRYTARCFDRRIMEMK